MQENELTRPCTKCKGSGVLEYGGGIKSRDCFYCQQAGKFEAPDMPEIFDACMNSRTHEIRKSAPSKAGHRATGTLAARSYYVWRLARFHGGKDIHMPMEAMMCAAGDPYQAELDNMADALAEVAFGTKFAGAMRWGQALGYV